MIARGLGLALRAIRDGKTDPKCQREPDFAELYPLLGNFEEQEAIRQSNADVLHCPLLINSSTACHSCPQNPLYKKEDAEAFTAFSENIELLEQAQYLHDLNQLGLGDRITEMLPEEFEVLRIMRQHDLLTSAQIQGNAVAHIIVQLFGNKS